MGNIHCTDASVHGLWSWDRSPSPTGGKSENVYRCCGFGRFPFLSLVQDIVAMLRNSSKYRYSGQQVDIEFSFPASCNQGGSFDCVVF